MLSEGHRSPQEPPRLPGRGTAKDGLSVAGQWPRVPVHDGSTLSGTNLLGRHFKPLLTRAELPNIRLHDLRHTCATILFMAGKHPKFVQEMFGHANISIT